ncbi:hypothetical protein [Brevundimonas bacteroides]|uniref:hypothetical protein n=1 Tax=Brevundimonas bacteroides TaxID=74311 RepID=UPI000496DB80|nr:hypothetical protein [Brevundimonas bacteroides]
MTCVTATPETCDAGSPPQPDPLWDAVRDAYLAGATVASLREDFGIPSSTFYKRAGREGWLHRPRAVPEAEALDLDAPVADPSVMLELAWRRLTHALDQGRSADALRWLRIHDGLKALAAAAPAATSQGAPARPSPPTVERVETIFPDSTASSVRPPPNRAERRRLARLGGGP